MHETIFFQMESALEWKDITGARAIIGNALNKEGYNKKINEIVTLICSELLENTFKHTSKKVARLTLIKTDEKNILSITMDNSIENMNHKQLQILENELGRINAYNDIQKLYLDSLLRSSTLNRDESKLGFSLIRKITNGARIQYTKSSYYSHGIHFRIDLEVDHFSI